MKFKVGDLVKVKSWTDLAKEIPSDDDGNLETPCCFPVRMRVYCGNVYRVHRAFCENGNNIYELETTPGRAHVLSTGGEGSHPWAFDECVLEPVDNTVSKKQTMYNEIRAMTREELSQFLYWVYLAGNADGRRGLQEGPDGFFSKLPEMDPEEMLGLYYGKFDN